MNFEGCMTFQNESTVIRSAVDCLANGGKIPRMERRFIAVKVLYCLGAMRMQQYVFVLSNVYWIHNSWNAICFRILVSLYESKKPPTIKSNQAEAINTSHNLFRSPPKKLGFQFGCRHEIEANWHPISQSTWKIWKKWTLCEQDYNAHIHTWLSMNDRFFNEKRA